MQGGGALGAYQAGVCEGLLINDHAPNWIVGTSIGAINGAIIAGNPPSKRIDKLREFWTRIASPLSPFLMTTPDDFFHKLQNQWVALNSMFFGLPNFFTPRLQNPWFIFSTTPDKISFYDTTPLKKTLEDLIDFDLINQKKVRLTVGALRIEDGRVVQFDNFKEKLNIKHIMASTALPPGFPAVRIDGKYYWDGGLGSNAPLSVIFEEQVPCKALCFIINLFSSREALPHNLPDVYKRKKDLEFLGKGREIYHYFCDRHQLNVALHKLWMEGNLDLENSKSISKIREMILSRPPSTLNLIRFHYKPTRYDLFSSDFEFSFQSINEHYKNGQKDLEKALEKPEWFKVIDDDLFVMNEL